MFGPEEKSRPVRFSSPKPPLLIGWGERKKEREGGTESGNYVKILRLKSCYLPAIMERRSVSVCWNGEGGDKKGKRVGI